MPATAVWERPAAERLQRALALAALAGILGVAFVLLLFVATFATPTDQVATPATRINAGNLSTYDVGEPKYYEEGRFWLVRLNQREVVALYAIDPRGTTASTQGCVVPWRETFSFTPPGSSTSRSGWFRNPCGGQTYDIDGRCVFGPCLRGLDRYPVVVAANGNISVIVDTNRLRPGLPLNRSIY